jgi:hypothetical protein
MSSRTSATNSSNSQACRFSDVVINVPPSTISAPLGPNPAHPAQPAPRTARKISLNYRCGSAARMLAAEAGERARARVGGCIRLVADAARCCRYRCRASSECNDVDGTRDRTAQEGRVARSSLPHLIISPRSASGKIGADRPQFRVCSVDEPVTERIARVSEMKLAGDKREIPPVSLSKSRRYL